MYLSKLRLNIRNSSARQALDCCQDMHVNLMKAFPGYTSRKEIKLIYRTQELKNNTYVYVQSEKEPFWENIAENGYIEEGTKNITSTIENISDNDVYNYNLKCMPYKKDSRSGSRLLLRELSSRQDWLTKKGQQYGFAVLEYSEIGRIESVQGIKRDKTKGFNYVTTQGVLRVTDKEKFKKAFISGIGPEKAYGLGLLLITKI